MLATSYTLNEKTTLPFDDALQRTPIAADVKRRLDHVVARVGRMNGSA
jgi:hypothetical protein